MCPSEFSVVTVFGGDCEGVVMVLSIMKAVFSMFSLHRIDFVALNQSNNSKIYSLFQARGKTGLHVCVGKIYFWKLECLSGVAFSTEVLRLQFFFSISLLKTSFLFHFSSGKSVRFIHTRDETDSLLYACQSIITKYWKCNVSNDFLALLLKHEWTFITTDQLGAEVKMEYQRSQRPIRRSERQLSSVNQILYKPMILINRMKCPQ